MSCIMPQHQMLKTSTHSYTLITQQSQKIGLERRLGGRFESRHRAALSPIIQTTMGSTVSKVARAVVATVRSGARYQCKVCTADSETAGELDKDPTRTMSNIGLVENKYF